MAERGLHPLPTCFLDCNGEENLTRDESLLEVFVTQTKEKEDFSSLQPRVSKKTQENGDARREFPKIVVGTS